MELVKGTSARAIARNVRRMREHPKYSKLTEQQRVMVAYRIARKQQTAERAEKEKQKAQATAPRAPESHTPPRSGSGPSGAQLKKPEKKPCPCPFC